MPLLRRLQYHIPAKLPLVLLLRLLLVTPIVLVEKPTGSHQYQKPRNLHPALQQLQQQQP
jgi:hypothetical protein